MAETENNGEVPKSGEDSQNSGQPPTNDAPPSSTDSQQVDPKEAERRRLQSERDKARSDTDDDKEQLDFLMSREMERQVKELTDNFLSENKDKYPNVKPEDLKYARSEEDLKEIAEATQRRFEDLREEAIRSVQAGSGTTPLTQEQYDKELSEAEKQSASEGKSTFGRFLNAKQRLRK